ITECGVCLFARCGFVHFAKIHMIFYKSLRNFMSLIKSILIKFGLADLSAERTPISVFVLDDDERRHRWFEKRFAGDELTIAATVDEAKEMLAAGNFDAIFLDHDLLPHHYTSNSHDDFANTGYAVAEFLCD